MFRKRNLIPSTDEELESSTLLGRIEKTWFSD
jgi:hypothetical protein